MEQALEIFKHEEFGGVRVIGDADNPRFCLSDVCKPLGLDASQVMKRLSDEVVSIHPIIDSLGRTQNAKFINEDGLYDVILDSRKPVAKKFRKWITSEVLPLIRKQGMYINPNAPIDPRFLRRMADELEIRDKKIAELQPKADYCVKVLESKEHLTSEQIAKEYGKTAAWLHETLIKLGAMYMRRRGKKYYYYMKSPYDKEGYRDSETSIIRQGMTVIDYYWTQKGRNFVYNFLKKHGILPVAEREDVMEALL